MRSLLTELETQRLALLQLSDAVRRSEAGSSGEHDHQLLVGVVKVIEVGGLPRRNLPEAGTDQLAA